MSKSAPTVDEIRKAFADITAALEDAALVATDGQAVTDLANARLSLPTAARLAPDRFSNDLDGTLDLQRQAWSSCSDLMSLLDLGLHRLKLDVDGRP